MSQDEEIFNLVVGILDVTDVNPDMVSKFRKLFVSPDEEELSYLLSAECQKIEKRFFDYWCKTDDFIQNWPELKNDLANMFLAVFVNCKNYEQMFQNLNEAINVVRLGEHPGLLEDLLATFSAASGVEIKISYENRDLN